MSIGLEASRREEHERSTGTNSEECKCFHDCSGTGCICQVDVDRYKMKEKPHNHVVVIESNLVGLVIQGAFKNFNSPYNTAACCCGVYRGRCSILTVPDDTSTLTNMQTILACVMTLMTY